MYPMADSDEAFEPPAITRTNSGSVILLDLVKGTLVTVKSKELQCKFILHHGIHQHGPDFDCRGEIRKSDQSTKIWRP